MIRKILLLLSVLILFIAVAFLLWRVSRPTEIVAVHNDNGTINILVKNFPITSRARVEWWIENKAILQQKYGVPELSREGISFAVVWGFGDGYLKEEPDPDSWFPSDDTDYLRCFADMKVEARCIKKENWQMYIDALRNNRIGFTVSGAEYLLEPDGTVIKRPRDRAIITSSQSR